MALVADAARPAEVTSHGMTIRGAVVDNHVTVQAVDAAMVDFVGVADAAYPVVDTSAFFTDKTPATTRAF